MPPSNITIQDVFDIDLGFGNHYFFAIMEENPICEGKVLALYVRTFDDPVYQDNTTIFLKGEHAWLAEERSWVCYQNPIVADKKYILAKAARFGPKLSDALYCRVMEDFCARKSDYLQPKSLEIYYNFLEKRNYNCLSKNCSDLAYYPPLFIKKSKSKGHS